MAQKIITSAQFKKLYHERVAKKNMPKAERQKAFDELWDSLPDYKEGVTTGNVTGKKKAE